MDSYLTSHEDKYLLNLLPFYPINKEGKFTNSGKVLYWPGCTIIYNIKESSKLSLELQKIQNIFKELPFSYKYSYLPQSSFHMTLFDCCNVSTFKTQYWPDDIPETQNYLEIANILSKRLNHYQFPNSITLKLNKFFGGFSTLLTPYSSKDEEILRNCRDDLSNLLGIKFKNHLSYTFHITLAYLLEPLTTQEVNKLQDLEKKLNIKFKNEIPMIDLSKPALCIFNDMCEFKDISNLT